MKNIIKLLLAIILFFTYTNLFATDEKDIYSIEYKTNILLWNEWNIDLSKQKNYLENKYNTKIFFEWISKWENSISWDSYEKTFDSFWIKEITLNIYKITENKEQDWSIKDKIDNLWEENKEYLTRKIFDIFVYKESMAIIFEKSLDNKIKEFKNKAIESWILVYEIWTTSIDEIEKYDYIQNIIDYESTEIHKSDYITIWWSKDFLFDILSKINSKTKNKELNIVLISSYNINILNKLLQNIISNKTWIKNIILLDEVSISQILKETKDIINLEKEIIENNYDFLNLNNTWKIHELLFISQFVNNLSNKWFNTINIYLILIIPFLLVWVSVFKHILWLSPVWILIPTSVTILFFKMWILITFILIIWFLIINLILAKLISKYKLHYTPKISLLTTLNIIFFIILLNHLYYYNLIEMNINDIMFIIIFILIAEKLITIIIWKEFGEYKLALINTVIFSFISFAFLNITLVKTIILAYPELILLLIPLSFVLWKFTWLRVTEYIRFREVIKSIEE